MSQTADSITLPPDTGSRTTRRQGAEAGFVASTQLQENLQAILVDFIALANVSKQAHWNIVGPNFRDLHLNLDEVVDIAREGTDDFAERMRALHAVPDGRMSVAVAQNSLPDFPGGEISTHDAIGLMVQSIEATTGRMRELHDAIDTEDPATADMLHEYMIRLEQQAWFISAEVRKPQN